MFEDIIVEVVDAETFWFTPCKSTNPIEDFPAPTPAKNDCCKILISKSESKGSTGVNDNL